MLTVAHLRLLNIVGNSKVRQQPQTTNHKPQTNYAVLCGIEFYCHTYFLIILPAVQ
jgi:hypothetical protein